MSKNTKANKVNEVNEVNEVLSDNELNELLDAIQPEEVIIEQPEPEVTQQPVTQQPATNTVNINTIIEVLPDVFTPATLDKLFLLNDGGKTVRRHLRKYFANDMGHGMKDKWSFNKQSNLNIIQYFASKYAFDVNAIKTK